MFYLIENSAGKMLTRSDNYGDFTDNVANAFITESFESASSLADDHDATVAVYKNIMPIELSQEQYDVVMQMQDSNNPAGVLSGHHYDTPTQLALMDACATANYVLKSEPLYKVWVPGLTDKNMVYSKDNLGVKYYGGANSDNEGFTMQEIEDNHLDGCERELWEE